MTAPHPDQEQLLECAVAAARAAGDHALANRHRRREVAERFEHDVKLHLDLECQGRAENVIRRAFPEHDVLGEEARDAVRPGEPLWIVDPIDGTVNFLHGLPFWCSSVAIRVGDRVLAGAVYAPRMKKCYTATADGPALCNGEPIRVSETRRLEEALVLTGLSKNIKAQPYSCDVLRAIAERVEKVRLMGSAALDICHVACGQADGYVETSIFLWDIAAAGLVTERAGGRTEPLEQLDDYRLRFLCTNGRIHDALRDIIEGIVGEHRV